VTVPIPEDARLPANDERLLLIAMVEELLRHDLALREPTDSGVDLVFPSQFTQDRPDEPDSATADVVFRFEGAVTTIYATLAVRLSRVADYRRERMWRNASTYRALVGGGCGLRIRIVDDGQGELTFLSYNSQDRAAVAEIAERLRAEGVLPWFDLEDIRPGQRWHDKLEQQSGQARSGAVFFGPHGLGPWQDMEQQAFVSQAAGRDFPIIPVWLPGAAGELPVFLRQWHAVDFRVAEPDPLTRLLWAVRGEHWRGVRR
jgi:hypothetical protein